MLLNNRYRIDLKEKPLGRGAFAEVRRAEDELLGRPVAVKLLDPKLVQMEGQPIIDQFMREVRAVARLNHPNLLTVYDMGQEGSQLFLVMELLEGGELTKRIKPDEPWTLEAVLDLLEPLAKGLEVAHTAGLVHRDIKPQNILYSHHGHPVLVDFGLVKVLSGSLYASGLHSNGKLLGTPEYMAPEQAHSQSVDARTDVYALGVLVYQLLTGRVPFKGKAAISTLFLACGTPREQLAFEGVDNAIADIVRRAVAIEMVERPNTPMAFVKTMQAHLKSIRSQAQLIIEAARAFSAGSWMQKPNGVQAPKLLYTAVHAGPATHIRVSDWEKALVQTIEVEYLHLLTKPQKDCYWTFDKRN